MFLETFVSRMGGDANPICGSALVLFPVWPRLTRFEALRLLIETSVSRMGEDANLICGSALVLFPEWVEMLTRFVKIFMVSSFEENLGSPGIILTILLVISCRSVPIRILCIGLSPDSFAFPSIVSAGPCS